MKIIFEHIQYAAWVNWCPITAFIISFSVFIACLRRAFRMPQQVVSHMEKLPLEETAVVDSKTVKDSRAKK